MASGARQNGGRPIRVARGVPSMLLLRPFVAPNALIVPSLPSRLPVESLLAAIRLTLFCVCAGNCSPDSVDFR